MLTIIVVAIFSGGRRGRSEPAAGRQAGGAGQGESSSWPGHDASHGYDVGNAGEPESGWGAGSGQAGAPGFAGATAPPGGSPYGGTHGSGSGPGPHGMHGFVGGPVDPSFAGPAFAAPDFGRPEGAGPEGGYGGRGPAPDGSRAGYWPKGAAQDNAWYQGAPGPVPGAFTGGPGHGQAGQPPAAGYPGAAWQGPGSWPQASQGQGYQPEPYVVGPPGHEPGGFPGPGLSPGPGFEPGRIPRAAAWPVPRATGPGDGRGRWPVPGRAAGRAVGAAAGRPVPAVCVSSPTAPGGTARLPRPASAARRVRP